MLSVYTRHYAPCRQSDRRGRHCHCPKWIRGVLPEEGRVRRSARTADWAEAEARARELERAARQKYARHRISVATAVRAYLAEQEGRSLSRGALCQSRSFLERRFLRWCANRGLARLEEIHTWQVREFRHTWPSKTTTSLRWHERLRAFFVFCQSNHWLALNPMDGIEKPRIRRTRPTDYFDREEFQRILEAAERYSYRGGRDHPCAA